MTTAQKKQPDEKPVQDDSMRPDLFRVQTTRRETRDTFTLNLTPAEGTKPRRFLPGQFNMLYAFGVGECAISISGDPSKPLPLMHTTRLVGTVTGALNAMKPGDMIGPAAVTAQLESYAVEIGKISPRLELDGTSSVEDNAHAILRHLLGCIAPVGTPGAAD